MRMDCPNFSVSIAYAYDGEMQLGLVYDPMLDACYTAQRGQGAWLNGEPIQRLVNRPNWWRACWWPASPGSRWK